MANGRPDHNLKVYKPYFFIAICGLLAYAPVSFMLLAMKNDIVALEYPINFFMSESLRNGEWPSWFNTWGMGFPLQSNLTWGIFSTPQIIFSGIFNYDIYTLHIEFLFFVILAGWSMHYLLSRFFLKDEKLILLLSLSYMLSGFITGSSQWLLYVTAASFIPMMISSLLHLFERPGWRYAIQFAIVYTLMFTSVYAAFSIITTYIIVFLILFKIAGKFRASTYLIKYLVLSGIMTLLLCAPILFYSLEVLDHLERGKALTASHVFFNSNFLHPLSLQGLLFPFSYGKMVFPNTEGSMLDSYMGIFVLLMLPIILNSLWKNRINKHWILFGASLFFLFLSFGNLLPFRNAINFFPGFIYFRNPALFRLFFMIGLILTIGGTLKDQTFAGLLSKRSIPYLLMSLAGIAFITILLTLGSLTRLDRTSVMSTIKSMNHQQALGIAACIQLPFLLLLWISVKKNKLNWALSFFSAELMINTLACGVFFTVSSYTPREVNDLLKIKKGFPVQTISPSLVPATVNDERMNTWQNVNVFSKQVSADSSYRGPLVLEEPKPGIPGKQLVFAPFDSSATINILVQRPNHIQVKVVATSNCITTLAQNYYPGWTVKVDGKEVPIIVSYNPLNGKQAFYPPTGISVVVPAGKSSVDFIYERKEQKYFAIILHILILSWLGWKLICALKNLNRSSSPS